MLNILSSVNARERHVSEENRSWASAPGAPQRGRGPGGAPRVVGTHARPHSRPPLLGLFWDSETRVWSLQPARACAF